MDINILKVPEEKNWGIQFRSGQCLLQAILKNSCDVEKLRDIREPGGANGHLKDGLNLRQKLQSRK